MRGERWKVEREKGSERGRGRGKRWRKEEGKSNVRLSTLLEVLKADADGSGGALQTLVLDDGLPHPPVLLHSLLLVRSPDRPFSLDRDLGWMERKGKGWTNLEYFTVLFLSEPPVLALLAQVRALIEKGKGGERGQREEEEGEEGGRKQTSWDSSPSEPMRMGLVSSTTMGSVLGGGAPTGGRDILCSNRANLLVVVLGTGSDMAEDWDCFE